MHDGHKQRLRYKALEKIEVLADHEILELILNFGVVRKNTNPLAHYLLDKYGTLRAVMESSYFALLNEPGVGEISASLLTLIPKLMLRYSINKLDDFRTIKNLGEAIHIFKTLFSSLGQETLFIACIGEEDRVITIEQVASGNRTQVDVTLAQVLKIVLKHNPVKIILAHNHLINSAMPSHSDIVFTEAVLSVMKNLNIVVFEHLVLTPGEEYSQLVARTIKYPGKNAVPLPKELYV
jgi:DNA repair protein RadC